VKTLVSVTPLAIACIGLTLKVEPPYYLMSIHEHLPPQARKGTASPETRQTTSDSPASSTVPPNRSVYASPILHESLSAPA
jgi:hypothetical protein